jgi:hypothetical protein
VGEMRPLQVLVHPRKILKSIKDKPADHPAKEHATPYRIQVLPLLNQRG